MTDTKAKEPEEVANYIDIVFDRRPTPGDRRVESVEDQDGRKIRNVLWVERDDGSWAIRVPLPEGPLPHPLAKSRMPK